MSVEPIQDIETLYSELEKNSMDHLLPHKISDLFKELINLKHKEGNKEECEKLQWEIDTVNFDFIDGKPSHRFEVPDEKGQLVKYPSLSNFNEKTYEYLDERLKKTSNVLLKARYAHILWSSPQKNVDYAKIAVDSYLELIKVYEKKDKLYPKDHYGYIIYKIVNNMYIISHQITYQMTIVHSEIIRLVKKFNADSSSSNMLKSNLIEFMLKRGKVFSKKEMNGIEDVCWEMHKSLVKKGNVDFAITILNLGNKIETHIGTKKYEWIKYIAKYYESKMVECEKGNNLASMFFCENAIENYRKIGDVSKIKELEDKYSKLKKSIKLDEYKYETDITDYVNECKAIATNLIQKNTSEEIIHFLMCSDDIIPKYKDIEKSANEIIKEHPIHKLFPTSIIDQNSNKPQNFSDEDEKKWLEILNQYEIYLQMTYYPRINSVLQAGINEKKLTFDILVNYLKNESWFGQSLSKTIHGKEISYDWLSLLKPSIYEYFNQIEYSSCSKNQPNFVLSIDSLTIKVEGLLRDLCHHHNINTIYMKEDNKKRKIVLEKDIQALLHEVNTNNLFDKNDILFFKFLLVEQAGYNLRHRIAHSLMLPQDYSTCGMNLLLVAILRLGKFKLREK